MKTLLARLVYIATCTYGMTNPMVRRVGIANIYRQQNYLNGARSLTRVHCTNNRSRSPFAQLLDSVRISSLVEIRRNPHLNSLSADEQKKLIDHANIAHAQLEELVNSKQSQAEQYTRKSHSRFFISGHIVPPLIMGPAIIAPLIAFEMGCTSNLAVHLSCAGGIGLGLALSAWGQISSVNLSKKAEALAEEAERLRPVLNEAQQIQEYLKANCVAVDTPQ
jgi:hypothetical protein